MIPTPTPTATISRLILVSITATLMLLASLAWSSTALAAAPIVTTDDSSDVTVDSATLNGTVDPTGVEVTDCHFEYGLTNAYGETVPCDETVGSGSGEVEVSADISGLDPKTPHHFRLVATNGDGTTNGNDLTTECFCYFGFESVTTSLSTTQAGAHPDFETTFNIAGDASQSDLFGQPRPHANWRDVSFELPAGLTGNPTAFPTCSAATFLGAQGVFQGIPDAEQCPVDSQVGVSLPGLWEVLPPGILNEPVYNLEAPGGDVVARLGTYAAFYPFFIDIKVDPERDNALTATAVNSPATVIASVTTILWGEPTDPIHDPFRVLSVSEPPNCAAACSPNPSGLAPTAFMTNPTSCGPVDVRATGTSYAGFDASPLTSATGTITGCESLPFNPVTDLGPTTSRSDSSSGMDVSIGLDQSGISDPNGLATAHLKKAVVTLPEGMSLNPSAADGLGSCSEDEIGLTSTTPIRFDAEDPTCPNASKVGTSTITTPVLDDPLEGSLYVAEQDDNPFDSLLAGYMVAKGQGVIIKLAGNFERDSDTGQITATFDNNPQQPFSELDLHFKGGARGVLATPNTCGTYQIQTELTPWSGTDPVTQTSSFTIDKGPDGGACLAGDASQPGDSSDLADRPFEPNMNAGVSTPVAGGSTPFTFRLTRPSGHQEILSTTVNPPQGLTAKLAGVPYCSEADIAAVGCPEESRIGTEIAGAGAGSTPFYTSANPGSVYLAGPYKGAPLSMVIEEPVIAGPFDLDDISVRAAIHVDPRTAQLTVISDEIPQINSGIPLRIRELRIRMDRPDFTIAPTNCDPMQVGATVQGSHGATANLTNHFQVGSCGSLGFSPKLNLSFGKGKKNTKPNAHPPLNAKLRFNEGDSNISSVEVALPKGVLLDQERLGRICSRANYAANTCPEESRVGYAKAQTPLLDDPVEGPVYLKASDNPLPDLAADLDGQIDVDLFGMIDQKENRKGLSQIRNTFDIVPDVPVSDFQLRLDGGNDGLLVNSRNICRNKNSQKVSIDMAAHNEMTSSSKPLIGSACKQLNKKKAKKLKKKAKKLQRKAKRANNPKKAKQLRKQARKLKKQARKIGR